MKTAGIRVGDIIGAGGEYLHVVDKTTDRRAPLVCTVLGRPTVIRRPKPGEITHHWRKAKNSA